MSRHLALFGIYFTTALAQTGTAVPSLAAFDSLMNSVMTTYSIPGASLAITRNGQLVYARGYGLADPQNQIAAQPDSRYRIASISKTVTAVTVMHLFEQGQLDLDAPAFALLPDLQPPSGATVDPRLASITIRQLLDHTGGWDDTATGSNFDPSFESPAICTSLGIPGPASTLDTIRYMRGQPLQFNPGTQYAYANFGYAVLGRIIEHVTKMSYEQYVRQNILAPMGISQMRIGQTLPQGRLPNEVVYTSAGNLGSVFAGLAGPVPEPYGSFYVESFDSFGGWVATPIDYAKFLNAVEGRRGTAFLLPSSLTQMTAKPANVSTWATASSWYGLGLEVNGTNWFNSGSLPGNLSYFLRMANGVDMVAFFNARPNDTTTRDTLLTNFGNGLASAVGQVTSWPTTDQFVNYPDTAAQTTKSQPALITNEGGVNGATLLRGVVSGSWVTLFGNNLSGTNRTWTAADIVNGNLPLSLDNVSVQINGQPAYVYYISPTQINVQAPSGLPSAWVTASVTYNGTTTSPILTSSAAAAPGAFTYASAGTTFAVATTVAGVVIGDPSITPGTTMAAPGSTIVIYATGLAATTPGIASPPSVDVTASTKVTLGAITAPVAFAGSISPGLFQINATVPTSVAPGYSPLVIAIGATKSPAAVMIAVQ
jgi:uncharacterized protein (TIGR03437 family)